MNFAAKRHQSPVSQRHGVRYVIQTFAHPIDVADYKRVSFAQVALGGNRYNHGAACATDAKRQAAGTRVSANFDRRTDLIELGCF
jgi:hypothetical protein